MKARLSSQLRDGNCCGDDGNSLGTQGLGRSLKSLSDLVSELQPSVRDGRTVFFEVQYLTAVSLWVFIFFTTEKVVWVLVLISACLYRSLPKLLCF
jgi:hypothetical protein